VFRRRQFEAALALRALFDDATRADWKRIDEAVGVFVGEHDSMTLPQLDALTAALGAGSLVDLAAMPDSQVAQTIIAGRFGTQRIASQIMVANNDTSTLTLPSAFLLFGQRYIVDSHVFSNVVYDRVKSVGFPARWLPNPLDVAFAALGNDQAGELLSAELLPRHALTCLRSLNDGGGGQPNPARLEIDRRFFRLLNRKRRC